MYITSWLQERLLSRGQRTFRLPKSRCEGETLPIQTQSLEDRVGLRFNEFHGIGEVRSDEEIQTSLIRLSTFRSWMAPREKEENLGVAIMGCAAISILFWLLLKYL